ncbi:MAG: hypothetical protein ACE361_26795 [Aureliella sp.]
MSMSAAEIEAIVRVVLQRVRSLPRGADAKPFAAGQRTAAATSALLDAAGELKIDDRVVSLECVSGRLDGITTLSVSPGAVITPAVHDELRSRKIRIRRFQPVKQTSTVADRSSSLLCVAAAEWQGTLLPSMEFITATSNCSADTGRVAAHINSGGQAAIWCSKTPFAALRTATKNAALVPIQLHRLQDFARAHQEASPNVVILDRETWTAEATLQLAQQWKGKLP